MEEIFWNIARVVFFVTLASAVLALIKKSFFPPDETQEKAPIPPPEASNIICAESIREERLPAELERSPQLLPKKTVYDGSGETDQVKAQSGKKSSAAQWIASILLGFILFLVVSFINTMIGFRHGGGALLVSLTTATIFSLCNLFFHSRIFKANREKPKDGNFKWRVVFSSLGLLVVIVIYSSIDPQIYKEKRQQFVDNTMSKTQNVIPLAKVSIDNPDQKLLKASASGDTSVKINKLWASKSSDNSYGAYTISTNDSGAENKMAAFEVAVSNDCESFGIYIHTFGVDRKPEHDKKTGSIIFDGDIVFISYTIKNAEDSLTIRISDPGVQPDKLLALMKKNNVMTVILLDHNIKALFSLQGFTASFNRIDKLCRSGAR